MQIEIYTLEKEDISPLEQYIPKNIVDNISEEGYYTLGAICYPEDDAVLIGMAQFYVDISVSGDYYAELIYVFILDEFRHNSAGVKLVKEADSILSGGAIDVIIARISPEDISELSEADIGEFLKECGFIYTTDNITGVNDYKARDAGQKRFFKFTGR